MKKILHFLTKTNFKTYFLSLLASAVPIILNLVLSRSLKDTPEAYDQITYLLALSTTFANFLVFGLNSFIIRETKNAKYRKDILSNAFTIYFLIVSFAIPICFYITFNTSTYTAGNYWLSFTIIGVAIVMGIGSIMSAFFQGDGKYHISMVVEHLIPKLVMLLLVVLSILLGFLYEFSNIYMVFYLVIYGVIAIICLIKYLRGLKFNWGKKEFASIVYFFGVTITYTLTSNLTRVFQGLFYSDVVGVLSIISISANIVSLSSVFTSILTNILKPVYAKTKREGTIDDLVDIYRLNVRVNLCIALPLFIFFIIHSYNFLYIFGYTTYPLILVILAINSLFSNLFGPDGTMLAMIGHEKWELYNGFVHLGVYAIFAFIFSKNSIYGYCLALLMSTLVTETLKFIETWIVFKRCPINLKTFITIVLIVIVDIPIIYVLRYISSFWIWLVVGILVGICIIVLNFLINPYRKSDFKRVLTINSED